MKKFAFNHKRAFIKDLLEFKQFYCCYVISMKDSGNCDGYCVLLLT